MMSSLSNANELSVTRTVYLENGNIVEPQVLLTTADGGFIIAGSSSQRAFVVKTDGAGYAKWRYEAPDHQELLSEETRQYTGSELTYRYVSGAVMQDGSIFLCGYIPYLKKGSSFLTHIDKDGKILSNSQLMHPKNDKNVGGQFVSCAAWNGGLVVVGQSNLVNSPEPKDRRYTYWITFFDASGKMVWEKLEPISKILVGFPDSISPLQLTQDGGFVFAGYREGMGGSEILHVKSTGEIAKNDIQGEFTLISSSAPTTDIQMISIRTASLTRLVLNGDLQEIGRSSEKHTDGHVTVAYSAPDNSILLFGNLINSRQYEAAIIKADASLKKEDILKLSPNRESVLVMAAVPFGVSGDFASVRGALKPNKLGEANTEAKMKEIRVGMALDFITSK